MSRTLKVLGLFWKGALFSQGSLTQFLECSFDKETPVIATSPWKRSAVLTGLFCQRVLKFERSLLCILICSALQCVAVCCSVLRCVAVCCSVLQCVAVCWSVFQKSQVYCHSSSSVCCSVLQCVAVCCNVLQCVAMCCSVFHRSTAIPLRQYVAVRCSVLQYIAACCSVFQCVAVCFSALRCFGNPPVSQVFGGTIHSFLLQEAYNSKPKHYVLSYLHCK